MKKDIMVKMLPVEVTTDDDSDEVSVSILGKEPITITKDEFDKRFGECIDVRSLIYTIEGMYNTSKVHSDKVKSLYEQLDNLSLSDEERQSVLDEYKKVPGVDCTLSQMGRQIEKLRKYAETLKE